MADGGKILVIDSDRTLLSGIRMCLEEHGHRVRAMERADKVIGELGKTKFDLLVVDLAVSPGGGIAVLREVKERHPEVLVVLMTGEATTESALQALRHGAHDYLVKPVRDDELLLVVDRAVERRRMGESRRRTAEELQRERDRNVLLLNELKGDTPFDLFIGDSQSMRPIRDLLKEVTRTDSTVLITGESGTGKGVLARYIHYNSSRSEKPFVEANCAIYSEGVLQSELFGHEKGAFTGAVKQKRGRFELAHEGTIFLDEIGDLSPGTQLMLLRVLQERKIERVGGEDTLEVDVRVIAATNKNLMERMQREEFRTDLYYRLNVIPIILPPLRERRDDVPGLALAILRRCAAKLGRPARGFSQEAMDALVRYAWPGNIREMENLLERTLILAKNTVIERHDLPLPEPEEAEGNRASGRWPTLVEHERGYIEKVLRKCSGNKKLAATVLGINRSSLYSKLKRLGISGNGASAPRCNDGPDGSRNTPPPQGGKSPTTDEEEPPWKG